MLRCRLTRTRGRRRIEEVAPTRLVEKFSRSSDTPSTRRSVRAESTPSDDAGADRPGEKPPVDGEAVRADRLGDTVSVGLGTVEASLTVEGAVALRDRLHEALTARREFLHTAGEHRADGAYVVERRGATSAGNAKVFESFAVLARLADRLPDEVVAEDFSRAGLTGGRRHMVLWHLVEHPAFGFDLERRQPLTARRSRPTAADGGQGDRDA